LRYHAAAVSSHSNAESATRQGNLDALPHGVPSWPHRPRGDVRRDPLQLFNNALVGRRRVAPRRFGNCVPGKI
jgi:hypothetical protein